MGWLGQDGVTGGQGRLLIASVGNSDGLLVAIKAGLQHKSQENCALSHLSAR